MAIRIKELETLANQYTIDTFTYKDLSLDLGRTKIQSPGLQIPTPGTDIKASYDLEAISNSLTNIFNTAPGQRFLFPEFGVDLRRYLFLPITEGNGRIIGNAIYNAIKRFEPRVVPVRVDITAVPDENIYEIAVVVNFPILNTQNELGFILDLKKESFISLPVKYT
jgi:phage baseplate assembly protein W